MTRLLIKAGEIPLGACKPATVQGKRVLVCHTQTGFYAIDDVCTHDDGPLADGRLDGNAIECPRHGARFDVTTGHVLCLPAAVPIRAYAVTVDGDALNIGDVSR